MNIPKVAQQQIITAMATGCQKWTVGYSDEQGATIITNQSEIPAGLGDMARRRAEVICAAHNATECSQEDIERILADAVAPLVKALQMLYDHQNGCPLPKYEKGWNEAMRLSEAALAGATTDTASLKLRSAEGNLSGGKSQHGTQAPESVAAPVTRSDSQGLTLPPSQFTEGIPREAEKDALAEKLRQAWSKYVQLFGQPPHGTYKQIRAMLEFTPPK